MKRTKKCLRRIGYLAALALLLAAIWFIRFRGVTHEQIYDVVVAESATVQDRIDLRYSALDRKLDRIESKLDRLLDLADRPLPDDMRKVD